MPDKVYGKYRGQVVDNEDPLALGRLLVNVPALQQVGTWALPCVPLAGKGVGFYARMPIGAHVWVEFEAGDVSSPIVSGAFWAEGDLDAAADSDFHLAVNQLSLIVAKEVDGPTVLRLGKLVVTMTSDGIEVTNGIAKVSLEDNGDIEVTNGIVKVSIAEETIVVESPGTTISLDGEAIALESGTSTLTLEADSFEVRSQGTLALEAVKDLSLDSAGADVTIDAVANVVLTAAKNLETNGENVSASATSSLTLTSGGSVDLFSAAAMAVGSGSSLDIEGPAGVNVNKGALEVM